eukprot:m.81704 g.81704  ORF g.81704 m.81704 type:complete len:128 (-) comp17582_c0_seq1:130-513(-)
MESSPTATVEARCRLALPQLLQQVQPCQQQQQQSFQPPCASGYTMPFQHPTSWQCAVCCCCPRHLNRCLTCGALFCERSKCKELWHEEFCVVCRPEESRALAEKAKKERLITKAATIVGEVGVALLS